jgi:hypothetical protein
LIARIGAHRRQQVHDFGEARARHDGLQPEQRLDPPAVVEGDPGAVAQSQPPDDVVAGAEGILLIAEDPQLLHPGSVLDRRLDPLLVHPGGDHDEVVLGEEGPGQPIAWVACLGGPAAVNRQAADVVEVRGEGEEDRVDPALGHRGPDPLLSRAVLRVLDHKPPPPARPTTPSAGGLTLRPAFGPVKEFRPAGA